MEFRLGFGLIEGFYGAPWSHRARLEMIEFLSEVGLNTFLRAPKNDADKIDRPAHPLTLGARKRLEELFRQGRERGVTVGCAITPEHLLSTERVAKRFRITRKIEGSASALSLLDSRVADVVNLGCKCILVAFDDTWTTFFPFLGRLEKGVFHGELAARVDRIAKALDPSSFAVLAPAIYHGRAASMSAGALAYLRGIQSAAPQIPVAWTGPHVFARAITSVELIKIAEATGLHLWIWNNRIANDWLPLATGEALGLRAMKKLSFGPVDNMGPNLRAHTAGILLNGAREPELSKISLRTLADYAHDGVHYSSARSHAHAARRATGGQPSAALELAYELTRRHALSRPATFEGSEFDALLKAFSLDNSNRAEVEQALLQIDRAYKIAHASDGALAREILPTLEKAALIGRALRLAISQTRPKADETRRVEIAKLIARAKSIDWDVGLDFALRFIEAELLKR